MTTKGTYTRRIRAQLRMTQEDFAHAIAVTASTVNRWENERSAPSRLARRAIGLLVRSRGSVQAEVAGAPTFAGR
jgi:DNA-binding transcriptional regulator YiaG